jgi:protein involved in polysaccharide export with SLBB domain
MRRRLSTSRPRGAGDFDLHTWLAIPLCAVVLLAPGCKSDHRMSATEFIQERQAAEAADQAPLSDEELRALGTLISERMGPFVVGPGDVLAVTVNGSDPEPLLDSVQARVDRKGEVFLPLVGAVDVAAMELQDVEDAIHRAFVPGIVKDASVYVALERENATEVLVKGAVEAPGLIPLRRSQRNLLYAIVLAGGVSDEASGRATLRRLRNPAQTVAIDLTTHRGLRHALMQDPLEQGDMIMVEAAMPNTVFVGGLVNLSRPQNFPQGVKPTVLQALAGAGGLRTDIDPQEATLIRRLPDGTDRHVKLDLDAIAAGEEENIVLAAGDILFVPHTASTRVQDFINRNFFLRAGISVNYSISGVEFMNRQDQQSVGGGGALQDQFDPFGFLSRNQSLNTLTDRPVVLP